jgi:hypothetical protein
MELNWDSDEKLHHCFDVEYTNGFGFQAQLNHAYGFRLHLARIYIMDKNRDIYNYEEDELFVKTIREQTGIDKIWTTDFIGRTYLSIHASHYKDIPMIINACLDNGYGIVTRTSLEVGFKPNDIFNLKNYEIKRIERLREMYTQWNSLHPSEPSNWHTTLNYFLSRPCKLHWNWNSQEGKDLCTEIRTSIKNAGLGCKSEISKKIPRFHWDWFDQTCRKYSIFHYCHWSIDDTLSQNEENSIAKDTTILSEDTTILSKEKEEENECIVCNDAPRETLVIPCGHSVACKNCSDQLCGTNNATQCIYCRQEITCIITNNELDKII